MATAPDLLNAVRERVDELALRIDVPSHLLPTYGKSDDGARPHIETDGDSFSYVIVERGIELQRDSTTDIDELLYWIFRSVTFNMGVDFELQHRSEEQDFRIILFRRQLELLAALKPHWYRRYCSEKRERLDELGIAVDPSI